MRLCEQFFWNITVITKHDKTFFRRMTLGYGIEDHFLQIASLLDFSKLGLVP